MRLFVLLPLLLVMACAAAGVYGVVHHQIAFAVAPEAFDEDLFERHRLPDGKRGRTGAAVVGVGESWWLGLVVGPPVAGFGLIVPGRRTYVKHSLIGFGIVGGVALLTGVAALLVSSVWSTDASLRDVWCPLGVTDRVAYVSVGTMRDFAFIGAGVGVFCAWAYLLGARERIRTGRGRRGRGAGRPTPRGDG